MQKIKWVAILKGKLIALYIRISEKSSPNQISKDFHWFSNEFIISGSNFSIIWFIDRLVTDSNLESK